MQEPPSNPDRPDKSELALGRPAAELLPQVYGLLPALARQNLAHEKPGTLQPTALVHEAYLRLEREGHVRWQGRGHFYAAAATAMRRILVERARQRASLRGGEGRRPVEFKDDMIGAEPEPESMLTLDGALDRLLERNGRWHEIVMLRFFSGLSIEETAWAMSLSPATVKNDWAYARAWLQREVERINAVEERA